MPAEVNHLNDGSERRQAFVAIGMRPAQQT